MENQEIWKDIPGYEGEYQVSDLGRVKSIKFGEERILKLRANNKGYYLITLSKNSKRKIHSVHQLIAMSFLDHKPNGNVSVIDHINSDKLDNRLENLRIVSQRENLSKPYERPNKSSKYVGVSCYKPTNKWISRILINGKHKHIGYFNTEEEAYEAYQSALKTLV